MGKDLKYILARKMHHNGDNAFEHTHSESTTSSSTVPAVPPLQQFHSTNDQPYALWHLSDIF